MKIQVKKSKEKRKLAKQERRKLSKGKSKYAEKKARQAAGHYSPTSPFRVTEIMVRED